ncbi:NADP-dependent oxidoreductase [Tomitella gaofuii]|uniref:NADP-dependent oxidoreductase n=1 Tax=Tomitella gaofuii TaxID=2760083 RepID=UPI0015FE2F3D|nr:NADP-dependent oxidoreductase [Tomitella gaofuii]
MSALSAHCTAGASRQVRLAARPRGRTDGDTWEITTAPVPEPGDGAFVVRTELISVDPAMRGWLDDVRSYVPPVGVGEVMRAHAVGRVVTSRHPDYPEGSVVSGTFGVCEHALVGPGGIPLRAAGVEVVDESIAPASVWLGALGFPGKTAYFGLTDVARMRPGETVLISGAAGAVGSTAVQIAKLHGCRVVGVAGGPDKCAWLTDELGADAAVDYKAGSVGRALRAAAPDGVDVYFDNVGGPLLDSALAQLRTHARIALCGAISGYNATEPQPGPSRYLSLLVNRASMQGFIIFDYADRFPEATAALSAWIRRGLLATPTQIVDGTVDDFGATLNKLFDGANTGKLMLRIA